MFKTLLEIERHSEVQDYLRPLGSFEELLWLMEKRSPLHATLVAHVDGATTVSQWEAALGQLRRRHPLWSAAIAEGGDGRPFFRSTEESSIPLRVVEGDFSQTWEQEVAWELSRRFDAERGPLVRAVLLHTGTTCMLILLAHHSVCDGMSLAFAIRDVLQALSGAEHKGLGLHSSQEEALGMSTQPAVRRRESAHSLRPTPGATVYRTSSSTIPEVCSLQFLNAFTQALRDRARQEKTTVHAALIAASSIAARRSPEYASGRDLHICSPINNRKLIGLPEDCGVFFTAENSAIPDTAFEDLWSLARTARDTLSPMQSAEGAKAVLDAVEGVVRSDLDAAAAAEQGGRLFSFDMMLTNLGVVPIPSSYGALSLRQICGPGVLVGLEGEQTLGISTFNGRLSLLHTSHTPLPGLLEEIESLLSLACCS
jgi:hypothetical protein